MNRKEIAIKYIATWEKNIEFIKERIEIQSKEGYNPILPSGIRERQYSVLDIEVMEKKILLGKKALAEELEKEKL